MGLYNFQSRFADKVKNGTKRHTIRAKRRYPAKVGDTLHLYTGLRRRGPIIQKLASGQVVRQKLNGILLRREKCSHVEDVTITEDHNVIIDGRRLTKMQREGLAIADGFSSFKEMMKFWEGRLPFSGDIIHWLILFAILVCARSSFGQDVKWENWSPMNWPISSIAWPTMDQWIEQQHRDWMNGIHGEPIPAHTIPEPPIDGKFGQVCSAYPVFCRDDEGDVIRLSPRDAAETTCPKGQQHIRHNYINERPSGTVFYGKIEDSDYYVCEDIPPKVHDCFVKVGVHWYYCTDEQAISWWVEDYGWAWWQDHPAARDAYFKSIMSPEEPGIPLWKINTENGGNSHERIKQQRKPTYNR